MTSITGTEQDTKSRYRLKRMRADLGFHPTLSLLDKAARFRAAAKIAKRNNRKVLEDPESRRMAQELIRHSKFWYTSWNRYRTGLKMSPDQEEIEETAKTRNGEFVQAAKSFGWANERGWDLKEPTRKLLRAALRLKTDPLENRRRLDAKTPTVTEKTEQAATT